MTMSLPIARRLLHDEVAERLRDLIQSGELAPHSRLNEIELADRFAISRTPLREAIRILSAEGLVELLPNRGARVAGISAAEIDEILDVIASLEATAGSWAAQRATPSDIEAVAALTDRMRLAYAARDEEAYFTLNRQIHERILVSAKNPTLFQLYSQVSSRIQRLRYRAHKSDQQWASAMADHEAMVHHLRAGRSDALARLMRDHVQSKRQPIADSFGEHRTEDPL